MTAFLSSFRRRISAASSPCPLNWSIWAIENQTRQGQITVLNIALRSLKEEGGQLGYCFFNPRCPETGDVSTSLEIGALRSWRRLGQHTLSIWKACCSQ